MPNYGPETRGDVVLSSDTTFNEQFLSFRSLTVQSGVTMTVPHLTTIFCTGVMEVNGTLKVDFGQRPADTNIGGGGQGGDGGGSVNILSFVISGSGIIQAPGQNGEDVNSDADGPFEGAPARIVHETEDITSAAVDREDSTPGESLVRVFDLYIENRLLAGTQVTDQAIQQVIAGAGAPGMEATGGGGGGLGGRGGDGNESGGTGDSGTPGGGAGGQIVIMTENLEDADLSITATGGRGGDRPNSSNPSFGGGGGGGGIVIFLSDKPPEPSTVDVSGGRGGDGSNGDGEAGADGIVMRYPVAPY